MMKIGNIEIGAFPLILSPMDEITDFPFRDLCKTFGADLLITEFIASDALVREIEKSLRKLQFKESQRPIGIQIFGREEEVMERAALLAEQFKPDFIDINWGCPVKKVAGKGAGSGILNDIPKMLRITKRVVDAVKLPVTVKTRLGYDEHSKNIVTTAEQLQDIGVKALSIHGRTRAQMYKGEADWTLIGDVKKNHRMYIPVFGNGDITTPEKVLEMKNRYEVDGVLIGRGAIGNPWIFDQVHSYLQTQTYSIPTLSERVHVCREHVLSAVAWKDPKVALLELRKHYGAYFKGIENFKPFRIRLVSETSLEKILQTLDDIEKHYTVFM